jgi:sigma-B regulation protein RsbU (phosphoserine phosphatase)
VVRDVMRRNLDMEKDQGAAQQIQQGLHPDRLPQPEGYELAEHYRSVRHVGGDYYDAIADDDRRLLLAIADVSGKGMPAALITANLQAILKFVDLDAQPLERLVASINTHLCRHTEPGRFVTMILGVLELGSRRFTYVNAGHNPAMRLHDGKVCALESTAPPLGTIETLSFPSAEVTLAPGDVLVLYTDGLSERRNAAGAFFDERGVEEALATCDGRTAGEIVECLVAASEAFAKETPPVDDTAIVVVRVLPGPGAD